MASHCLYPVLGSNPGQLHVRPACLPVPHQHRVPEGIYQLYRLVPNIFTCSQCALQLCVHVKDLSAAVVHLNTFCPIAFRLRTCRLFNEIPDKEGYTLLKMKSKQCRENQPTNQTLQWKPAGMLTILMLNTYTNFCRLGSMLLPRPTSPQWRDFWAFPIGKSLAR